MLPIALRAEHWGLGEDDDRHGTGGDRLVADRKIGLPKPRSSLCKVLIGMISVFGAVGKSRQVGSLLGVTVEPAKSSDY